MIEFNAINAVLVPVNARVDLFQQLWLVKNEIVSEAAKGIFTPVAVQCADDDIEVVILPNRIQVTAKAGTLGQQLALAVARLDRLIERAGSALVPYQGVGINAVAIVLGDSATSLESHFIRDNEYVADLAQSREFAITTREEAMGGSVVTKIERVKHVENSSVGVRFDFNFHRDATDLAQARLHFAAIDEISTTIEKRVALAERVITQGAHA